MYNGAIHKRRHGKYWIFHSLMTSLFNSPKACKALMSRKAFVVTFSTTICCELKILEFYLFNVVEELILKFKTKFVLNELILIYN